MSRTTPAMHTHSGAVAPEGWAASATAVARVDMGRPVKASDMGWLDVARIVTQGGGVRKVAREIGWDPGNLSRAKSGAKAVTPGLAEKLRSYESERSGASATTETLVTVPGHEDALETSDNTPPGDTVTPNDLGDFRQHPCDDPSSAPPRDSAQRATECPVSVPTNPTPSTVPRHRRDPHTDPVHPRPPCVWCARRAARRRGLCRCCYRKAKDAALLPPRIGQGGRPAYTPDDHLRVFVRWLPVDRAPLVARLLAEALKEAS